MNEMIFRPAKKEECRMIAALYRISTDGVADYIWTTLAQPGEDILDVGQRRYEQEDSVFSYKNCVVAELEGKIAGMMVGYPIKIDKTEDISKLDPVLVPYRPPSTHPLHGGCALDGEAY